MTENAANSAMSIVVDASVSVKWFLPERHSAEANAVLHSGRSLLAPDLIFAEVGSVLWKRIRAGEVSVDEAQMLIVGLVAMPLRIHSMQGLINSGLEIAAATGRTVYDCLYVALAVREHAILATADERLHNSLAPGPFGEFVCWIGDANARQRLGIPR